MMRKKSLFGPLSFVKAVEMADEITRQTQRERKRQTDCTNACTSQLLNQKTHSHKNLTHLRTDNAILQKILYIKWQIQGMDKIMDTLDNTGIKLFMLAALKEH
jgi:hypothetical protein